MHSLSVIIPTLNCASEMPAHIRSMEPWLELADEIIAVDSESEDGTAEIIRDLIRHKGLKSITHPRGLYQSWNHAISLTTGKWIYISTIGDCITREQLEHLLAAGESLNADVVISPPEFIFDSHLSIEVPEWPVHRIVAFHEIEQPTVIDPLAAFAHAVRATPEAILGSSASNLYRGDHLRNRPFPTCFRMAGDTGWVIRHALNSRFCYTNRTGSVFRFHSETYTCPDYDANKRLIASLQEECVRILREKRAPENNELFEMLEDYLFLKDRYMLAREEWGLARRESFIPWYLRPSAVSKRKNRQTLKKKYLLYPELLNHALGKLPLQTAS